MAEEKKGGEEKSGGGGGYTDVFFWLIFVLALWIVGKQFLGLFNITLGSFPDISSVFVSMFDVAQVISIFLSLVFVLGILYVNFKLGQLSHHHDHHGHGHEHAHGEHTHHHHPSEAHHSPKSQSNYSSKQRWGNILKRSESQSEGDWRLAIIECDILLDEMLKKMGYHGESIADKLKLVEKSDFHTLDEAWEAHKVRNRIAHSGSDFHFSRSEFERVFHLYKKVFEEFYFI